MHYNFSWIFGFGQIITFELFSHSSENTPFQLSSVFEMQKCAPNFHVNDTTTVMWFVFYCFFFVQLTFPKWIKCKAHKKTNQLNLFYNWNLSAQNDLININMLTRIFHVMQNIFNRYQTNLWIKNHFEFKFRNFFFDNNSNVTQN